MAVSVPAMIDGRYIGVMDEKQVEVIKEIRNSEVVPVLKNTILQFPPELVLRSIEEKRAIRDIVAEENIDISKYVGTLRDYQTVGAAFMYFSPKSMIADGVGLGKTVEVASLINLLYNRGEMSRFMIAVESGALAQTQCELIKMTGLHIVSLPSEKDKLIRKVKNTDWSKVNGIVIKHTLLRSDAFSKILAQNIDANDRCRLFDTFFLDESSCIKNDTTKMYQYTYNICQLARRVHFMNATAFELKLLDVYYQMDMMYPELLPQKSKINNKYCTYSRSSFWKTTKGGERKQQFKWDLSGYKNQEHFKNSLEMVYFGRNKQDVGLDRPNIYKVYTVSPTVNQSTSMAKLGRTDEILNCPSLVAEAGIATSKETVPKIARLVDLVENEFNGSSIMIYVFHREAQEVIRREMVNIGRKPLILNGEVEQAERYEIQQKFNNGEADVLITNIKKSINLYGGDVCIFYSLISNPSSMIQVAGRIDRNVDERIKTFVLLLYEATHEYKYFNDIVAQRSQDAKDLTIGAKNVVDYFIEQIKNQKEEE